MAYAHDARSSLDGPALPSSDITALAALAAAGDDRACTEVVRAIYPRLHKCAREVCARFRCAWMLDDVVGAGIEATLSAFSTWKVAGLPFLVYALERARWQMTREIRAMAYPVCLHDKVKLSSPACCFVPDSALVDCGVDVHSATIRALDAAEFISLFAGRDIAYVRHVLAPTGGERSNALTAFRTYRRARCLARCRQHARVYRPWRVTERKHAYSSR